ncbi:MAG: UDP-N-acetylmuramoyl-tripeptide--D-alanyl-D-alanine ligase [Clostridioides sp.]|jgi:UDP-N-acetylmuramoyl-tripeptide--D-alanyl-D-alanine ligase|nr:UDP-N-acetylmuramoyl-tripeptide--D-alanyl-D-alanine ligase [Clostridioides sp.]
MNGLSVYELVIASRGTLLCGDLEYKIDKIAIDSREVGPDIAFIPIKGENQDGHKFIRSAVENGCRTVLKDKNYELDLSTELFTGVNIVEVSDTTLALGDIARYYRKKFEIDFIGITGSVGKTTTRDMVYAALSSKFNVLKNERNLNNHLGVPLTLFNLNKEHDCAIIEMGMSGFGEIDYLVKIVNPKIAVISNIGTSHIENLGSRDGIFKAKMEITSDFGPENTLIVNGDDEYLSTLKDRDLPYKLKTFGFGKGNDVYCEEFELDEKSTTFTCVIGGEKFEVYIPIMGEHNIYNAMAAILVGLEKGLTIEEIKRGFMGFTATKMRLDIDDDGDYTIINDSYNASPDSMKAALKVLGRYDKRRVAVLGDMLEMGDFEEEGHRIVGKCAAECTDVVIAIGESSKYLADEAVKCGIGTENVHYFETKELAMKNLNNILHLGDVVLVKASRGMKLEVVVEFLK